LRGSAGRAHGPCWAGHAVVWRSAQVCVSAAADFTSFTAIGFGNTHLQSDIGEDDFQFEICVQLILGQIASKLVPKVFRTSTLPVPRPCGEFLGPVFDPELYGNLAEAAT
jgi:hypothetical protein